MTGPAITFTAASTGWLATCECGWERWEPRRTDLAGKRLEPTCKKVHPKTEQKARPRADWSNREDSTWIDKL